MRSGKAPTIENRQQQQRQCDRQHTVRQLMRPHLKGVAASRTQHITQRQQQKLKKMSRGTSASTSTSPTSTSAQPGRIQNMSERVKRHALRRVTCTGTRGHIVSYHTLSSGTNHIKKNIKLQGQEFTDQIHQSMIDLTAAVPLSCLWSRQDTPIAPKLVPGTWYYE